ncbi:Putative serine/threonine-protein kinase pknH [Minicystis rosea]|nr:Putative serine/threonine-protein kinase pknH [Minicystis rosea]
MHRTLTSFLILTASVATFGCSNQSLSFAPLAYEQQGVSSMATDGGHVYWTTPKGALRRVSIDGGQVETVVENITNPANVTVDGTHVYWTENQGVIARAAKAGGTAEMLAANESDVVGLRVDDTNIYWARRDGVVKRLPKIGSEETVIADQAGQISAVALTSLNLLWSYNSPDAEVGSSSAEGAIQQAPVAGGTTSTLAATQGLELIATNDTRVFWTGVDTDALATDPLARPIRISSVSLDGSDEHVLASDLEDVDTIIADESHVFFSTTTGDVNVLPTDGGTPTTFASGPTGKTSFTFDTSSVYWAHAGGNAVFVLPKQSFYP